MSWATLFERADDHEASLDDVRAALSRRRETSENDDSMDDADSTGNDDANENEGETPDAENVVDES